MGIVKGVSFSDYPIQGSNLGKRVSICYNYNSALRHEGVCIRDDMGEPFRTIFQLDNGRVLDAVECMWSPQ